MSNRTNIPADAPSLPPVGEYGEIADGVFAINLPVPFKGLRQVTLWLLKGDDGWTMIDCGWGDEQTRAILEKAWKDIVGSSKVSQLIVTHFHPDHMGNCGWIAERWGVVPQVTRSEWFAAQLSSRLMFIDDIDAQSVFFRENGVADEQVRQYREGFILYDRGVTLPRQYHRLVHGQTLRFGGSEWKLLVGAGHSPEMATFFSPERKLYISADQVLPRISSNVGVPHWEPMANPLVEFLTTLDVIAEAVSPEALVLPAHGHPFYNAPQRIADLHVHHDQRLEQLLNAFAPGDALTAGDCMPALFSYTLDGTQIGFAIGEIIAHLNQLVAQGRLTRFVDLQDVVRFRRI